MQTLDLQTVLERFFDALVNGDRPAARTLVAKAKEAGLDSQALILDLFWPTYQTLERLDRADQISKISHHLATRLLRVLIDQSSASLTAARTAASRGRTILAFCGNAEQEELAAQMAVDLLEANGFEVNFAGGGIAADEILARVNETQPDILLTFASNPADLPGLRELIDQIRSIGACPGMQFAVGAGVFNRAEGLAEEIGADLWAKDPMDLVQTLVDQPSRRADAQQRTVGKSRIKSTKKAA